MVEIKPKDLYQFLLTECRYGYTRNNHLMPDGAYRHVEDYLPELLKADKEMAINTAKQLCEECIDMELIQFYDGIDDEHGNRSSALKFIAEMRSFVMDNSDRNDCCWMPYNWDQFTNQLALDNVRRYDVYEAEYTGYSKLDDEREFKLGRRINCCDSIAKNELMTFIGGYICNSDSFTYRKYEKKPSIEYWNNKVFTKEEYNKQILTKYVFDDIKKAVIVKRGDC